MHGDMTFLTDLIVILLTSLIGGYVTKRFNYPAVLGQIVGGIIIGPSLLGLVHHSVFIENIAQIGVILLMFLAGLETDVKEMKKNIKSSVSVAVGGIVVPFLMGAGAILLMKDYASIEEIIFTGVILTATSMGITIQTLGDLGILKSKLGTTALSAAVIDDVVGVVILTIVLGIFGQATTSIEFLIIKILAFFLLVIGVGRILVGIIAKNKTSLKKISSKIILIGSIVLAFLFAMFANEFGVAAIIGAYAVGVILSMTSLKHRIEKSIVTFGSGFFIPVFFINIGLSINLSGIGDYIISAIIIMIVGIASKVIGSGLGAYLSGFSEEESLNVGISMVPRAEVALIITSLGVKAGFIGVDVLMGIILLVVVSTIVTPLVLKKRLSKDLTDIQSASETSVE